MDNPYKFITDYSIMTRYELLLKYRNIIKKDYSIMLHLPDNGAIMYLVEGWKMVLNYLGVKTFTLPIKVHEYKENNFIKRNNIKYFITCADEFYLSNVDSTFLQENGVKIGHISSPTNEFFNPVDFLIDFSMNKSDPKEVNGVPIRQIKFGCNPIIHYTSKIEECYDYYFIGTRSFVKDEKTRNYLLPIIDKYKNGILMGKGFNKCLDIAQAATYYSKALVSPNYHTQGQIDQYINVNERTVIIPACGGFEVVDNPQALPDVFDKDEIVWADNPEQYLDHVDYFIEHPVERAEYIYKGMKRVYEDHNLFDSMIELVSYLDSLTD